jgi:hypothetical protein
VTSEPEAPGATDAPVRPSRGRRTLVWALIVIATVIAIVSTLTTWVNRQMLNEQSWRDASAELIEDPEVRDALSVYLVNQLYDNVDIAGSLEERLPPDLKPLAGPVAGALREPTTEAVGRLLAAPRIQDLWVNASSLAQQKLVNVLENNTGHGISTGEGTVTLDLSQLVRELGAELGVSASALDRIPPDAGVITVMQSSQLEAAQTAVRALKVLSVLLFVIVFGLYALAVYLAAGERRRALRNVGWALVLLGLVILVARRAAGNYAIEQLTSPTSQNAGERAWLIGSSILGNMGWAAILYGVVTAFGAILAGPTRWATAVRRRIAPVLNRRPGVAWAVVGGAYLLLLLWGPTPALRAWWGIILFGALLAAGILALRHQTRHEFPATGYEDGTVQVSQAVPVDGNGEPAEPPRSPAAELAQLHELHAAGAITDGEFDRAKKMALAGEE